MNRSPAGGIHCPLGQTVIRISPADRFPVHLQPAGVMQAATDYCKRLFGGSHCQFGLGLGAAPADWNAVRCHGARVPCTAAYGHKRLTRRRLRLRAMIVAPAYRGPVMPRSITVRAAVANGDKLLAWRRLCLLAAIVPPADGSAVVPEGAYVAQAAADGNELFLKRCVGDQVIQVAIPAFRGPIPAQGAGVVMAAADGGELLVFRGLVLTLEWPSHFMWHSKPPAYRRTVKF